MARRGTRSGSAIVVATIVGTATAMAWSAGFAPPAAALPPPSVTVTYEDATVLADCTATGLAGVYVVTGQAAPRLPLMDAEIRCTVNGMPTLTSLPTLHGLVGSAIPVLGALTPLLAPAATSTAVGVALALTEQVTVCLAVDTALTLPLLPPLRNHIERCAVG